MWAGNMKKLIMLCSCLSWLGLLPLITAAQFDSLSNFRYYDKRGINVFEPPKVPVTNDSCRIRLGVALVQQFQSLSHNNTDGGLYAIRPGFTTAMANLYINAQLMPGMRFNIGAYLSSRYHNEVRWSEASLQVDKLPLKGAYWDQLMSRLTIKAGYMEINYGDAHFRRTNGGLAMYDPLVENYILDAYTQRVAAELYIRKRSFFVAGGMAAHATIADSFNHRPPAVYCKAGFDNTFNEYFRARLSASCYHDGSDGGDNLYSGDQAGSNYFMVLEKAGDGVTYATNAFSGRFTPCMTKKVTAFQMNGFLKLIGFELFGTYEQVWGRSAFETSQRRATQYAIDWVMRFGANECIYIACRYNSLAATLPGYNEQVEIERVAMSAGYFLTRNILLKAELVDQLYEQFPESDYRNGGHFKGGVLQAVVSF